MSSKGYLAIWAGSALLATGVLAGCDAGNQQQDPGSPATEESGSDNMAMYEPDDTTGGQTGTTDDPTTASDPYSTTDPSTTSDDPLMGSDRSTQSQSGQSQAGQSLETMSADQIVGKPIVSREGEEIGDVQEVVTDPTSGQKFAVVDVGGFLGVGQKSIVIAFDELQASDQDRLQSDLTRETLQTKTEYSPGDYEPVSGSGESSGQETTQ